MTNQGRPQRPPSLTIVHTEASMSWGGQGIRILEEALWMRRRGHRPIVIAPAQSRLLLEVRRHDVETYALPFTKQTQGRDVLALVRLLRRLKPDIVNTHSSVDTWVGCLAGRISRVPALIRTRHLGTPVRPHLLNRWLYRSLCDHVITTAEVISTALTTTLGLKPSHVSTIATGIQPPVALPSPSEARQTLIRELHLPPRARFIGCLAVLRQGKGHLVLLDAFRQIRDQLPDHHLVIIGDGGYRETLDARVTAWNLQDRVHFTGFRADPWPLLRALDAKVLASISHEGTPQALVQAQFAGCPVVGSTCGGIAEVIVHDKTGLLVPRGDAQALGQALLRLLGDRTLAATLTHQARQHVRTHYTIEGMGQKLLALYRDLLGPA